jgi:hypothetical protein
MCICRRTCRAALLRTRTTNQQCNPMGLASARGSSTLDGIIYSQRLLIRGLLAACLLLRTRQLVPASFSPAGRTARQRPARGRRRHGAVLAAAGAEDVAFAVSVCVSRAGTVRDRALCVSVLAWILCPTGLDETNAARARLNGWLVRGDADMSRPPRARQCARVCRRTARRVLAH